MGKRLRWEDHSRAWRAKASAQGMTRQKYNAWSNLSPETRKRTSQREYAAGKSVPQQHREKLERDALRNILRAASGQARPSFVRKNLAKMSAEELRWTIKATPNQLRYKAARKNVPGHATNPWWYR